MFTTVVEGWKKKNFRKERLKGFTKLGCHTGVASRAQERKAG